jgi:hypothetical protein
MPKADGVSDEYNVLFQEVNMGGEDPGQSCHVFALGSPITWDERSALNNRYSAIADNYEVQRVVAERPLPVGDELEQVRNAHMQRILDLRNTQETVMEVGELYLCGGFREGKVMPEHMWIEDRTNGRTYDTFIDRGGIALRSTTGVNGQAFQPGCEEHAFSGGNIKRVRVDGYTMGQLIAIAAGAENVDGVTDAPATGFPAAIEDEPAILAARAAVQSAREAVAGGDVASTEFRVATREGARAAFEAALEGPAPEEEQVPEQQVSSIKSTLAKLVVGVGLAVSFAASIYLASDSSNQP